MDGCGEPLPKIDRFYDGDTLTGKGESGRPQERPTGPFDTYLESSAICSALRRRN